MRYGLASVPATLILREIGDRLGRAAVQVMHVEPGRSTVSALSRQLRCCVAWPDGTRCGLIAVERVDDGDPPGDGDTRRPHRA